MEGFGIATSHSLREVGGVEHGLHGKGKARPNSRYPEQGTKQVPAGCVFESVKAHGVFTDNQQCQHGCFLASTEFGEGLRGGTEKVSNTAAFHDSTIESDINNGAAKG